MWVVLFLRVRVCLKSYCVTVNRFSVSLYDKLLECSQESHHQGKELSRVNEA